MLGNVTPGGLISTATSGAAIGMVAGPIGAGIGAAVGAVAGLISGLWTNVDNQEATTCANNAQYTFQANLDEWNNYPPNMKTKALQVQYMNQALQIWSYLQQCCGQPQLGDSGRRCLTERARGGQYDYLAWYYDPIANDPQVFDPTTQVATTAVTPIVDSSGNVIPTSTVTNTATSSTITYLEDEVLLHPYLTLGGLAALLLVAIL